jgi:signal transduction histidine kinase
MAQTAFRAAGGVPIRGGGGVCGALTFFSYCPQEPEPALAVLLTGIAGTIGGHLEQRRADVLTRHLAAVTDEYIALVGHELRTPLTSIASYVDLIAESADETLVGDVRDLLEVVQRNSARLRAIIERLLDLAALESGNVGLSADDVDLVAVVAAAAGAAAEKAGRRGITIDTALPVSLVVPGDEDRLRQVVDNLLDNAIKFSPAESAVAVGLTADGAAAVLTVSDRGVGVPASGVPHVFRRLFRADNVRHSGVPGAGLGLALSRVVVERHHGAITLGSEPGAGTTVTVRLPRSGC